MRYDERIYRSPHGRPSLQTMKGQLERLRQDYQRFSGKDVSPGLRQALKQKITDLEAEIQQIEKAKAANAQAAAAEASEIDLELDEQARRGGHRVSRRFPPRFRAMTAAASPSPLPPASSSSPEEGESHDENG